MAYQARFCEQRKADITAVSASYRVLSDAICIAHFPVALAVRVFFSTEQRRKSVGHGSNSTCSTGASRFSCLGRGTRQGILSRGNCRCMLGKDYMYNQV